MSKFYVGQRVRINCPDSPRHGMTGTIYHITDSTTIFRTNGFIRAVGVVGYRIDVDGVGKYIDDRWTICCQAHQLIPLDDFDVKGWWDEHVMKPVKRGSLLNALRQA